MAPGRRTPTRSSTLKEVGTVREVNDGEEDDVVINEKKGTPIEKRTPTKRKPLIQPSTDSHKKSKQKATGSQKKRKPKDDPAFEPSSDEDSVDLMLKKKLGSTGKGKEPKKAVTLTNPAFEPSSDADLVDFQLD